MKARTIVGLALVVLGVAALAFRSFSYTKRTHRAKVVGLELSFKERETVEVPAWVGAGAVAVGTALLLAGRKG